MIKSKGPMIDPLGTPHASVSSSESVNGLWHFHILHICRKCCSLYYCCVQEHCFDSQGSSESQVQHNIFNRLPGAISVSGRSWIGVKVMSLNPGPIVVMLFGTTSSHCSIIPIEIPDVSPLLPYSIHFCALPCKK